MNGTSCITGVTKTNCGSFANECETCPLGCMCEDLGGERACGPPGCEHLP
jgi:hypothetical protein